jgi:uncharacterized protein YecA (UPF0149 family)
MIRYGKMPQMNMASGCEYNYPEFQDYIRKADVVSVQIGSNDAFVPCIVALGNATNWKSEKLAAQGLRVGRNDPCPCGSGKKYKQCHGKLG